jgi:hypothetical protein
MAAVITTSDARPTSGSRPIHAAARRGKRATAATHPQRHPRPARKLIYPRCVRCGAQFSRCLPAPRRQPEVLRDGDIPPSPRRCPAGGLLARRRIAIARFCTDVAAVGGISPALVAGLDPADYPVVPGGVPQAWERAQVYLGLCERYQELYQAQVAELHLLMATVPGCSLPLSHRRPLTDPLTDTHTGYISLIRGRRPLPITQCDGLYVGGYLDGRGRSRPTLTGRAHAPAACGPPFRLVLDIRDQAQQRRLPSVAARPRLGNEPTK